MKISTKGRYALRMMLDIAIHDEGGPVRVKEIASRQEISTKYLQQIVSILARAGYVKSIRSPTQGGYRLSRKPGGVYGGLIPSPDRRQPGTCGMSGRGDEPVSACRSLPYPCSLAGTGQCH